MRVSFLHTFTINLFILNASVFADLIASSNIQKCYASTSSNSTQSLNCNQKVVISISLDNNELQGSNSIMASLTTTSDNNNSNIQYYLKTPIQIQMSKSQVYALYPLTYVQDFNNKPMENVLSSSLIDCKDGDYDKSPTCGFQYDSSNQKILYSQGYCCECSFLDTIGLDNTHLSRGNICKALNIGQGSASAHCLHMDDLWYSGFKIGTHQTYYSITINVNFLTPTDNSNSQNQTTANVAGTPYFSSSIRLGSFKNADFDTNKTVLAKIIGDFYPLNPPPDLTSYYLMKPSHPLNDPIVLQGMSRWMFVPKEGVTLDGTECDKIGVSYEAFQNQANKCSMIIGSCLKNQLEDMNSNDLQRIAQGQNPQYLLSSQGNFLASQNQDQINLLLEVSGSFATMLTLEISADNIQYITNLGLGEIDYATITNFEAFSNNGKLNMMVTNTGELTAEFDLYIDCDISINPISYQKFFINPMESKILSLDIATNNINNKNHSCEIYLKDAIGQILDTKIVNFTTTEINYTSAQNNSNNVINNAISQPVKQEVNCDDICPNFYDIVCAVANSCSGNIWKFVLFTFFLTAFSLCCCYCLKRKPNLICTILSWIFKKSDDKEQEKKNDAKKKNQQNRRKRAQSLKESVSNYSSQDSSSYYNDYEYYKKHIYSNDFRRPKEHIPERNIMKRPKHQNLNIYPINDQKPEVYCYDEENRSFYLNNEISQEICEFDTRRNPNSSEILNHNDELPSSILSENKIRKYFININHKHECWREYEFPFDFSVQIILLVPRERKSRITMEDLKIFLSKESELKYLVQNLYENQTELILSEILRICLANMIFLTQHPIYKVLTKEDLDRER